MQLQITKMMQHLQQQMVEVLVQRLLNQLMV
jgi:hypothetical protein